MITMQEAIVLYEKGLGSVKISKLMGCSPSTLLKKLRQNNIKIKTNTDYKAKIDFYIIKQEYESGMSLTEIANQHHMNAVSIWERLKRGGVKLRDRKEEARKKCTKIIIQEHPKICERYLNKENAAEIARSYNVNKDTICDILRKNNIQVERAKGERVKHLWKGGITPLHTKLRHCEKGRQWIRDCMVRDDYTCQITGQRGKKLHIHHKKEFSKIFQEFLAQHLDLDPIDDCDTLFDLAKSHNDFWRLDNGITICEEIHRKLHE